MAGTGDQGEDASQRAMSGERVERFRRLMAAQERIAEALMPYGITDAELEAALAAAEDALPRDQHDDRDFYLPALELYVGALGGWLDQGAAVFPDVTVEIESGEQA